MTAARKPRRTDRVERWMACLVRVYPPRFRRLFGDELVALYRRERRRVGRHEGTAARRLFDARTLAAALTGIAREWMLAGRSTFGRVISRGSGGPDRHPTEPRPSGRGSARGPAAWVDALATEGRFALRGLRRSPGFATTVVVVLGLGVGANAAMFEMVDQLYLRPPPYLEDPAATHTLYYHRTRNGDRQLVGSFSYPMYEALAAVAGFEALAASATREPVATLGDRPRRIRVMGMSAAMWGLFDATPTLGRFFGADEDRPPEGRAVAVLSHGFWVSEYGRDPTVLGRKVVVAGRGYTIVGVAPPGFRGMAVASPKVFVPLTAAGPTFIGEDYAERASTTWLQIHTRTRVGADAASLASATGVIRDFVAERAGSRDPAIASVEATFQPFLQERGPYARPIARFSLWLLGTSGIVFLVACANVATLLTGRALRRRNETAVRAALGVRGTRLLLSPFLESLALAAVASLVAVPVGHYTVAALALTLLPESAEALSGLAPRSALFGGALLLLGGTMAGVVPALQARRIDLARELRADGDRGGRRSSRAQSLLPVGQAALSALLLVGAGLFVRSVARAASVELGYDADRVLVIEAVGSGAFDMFEPAEALGFRPDDLGDRARALPGIAGAAYATGVPFHSNVFISLYREDGTPAPGSAASGSCTGNCSAGEVAYGEAAVSPDYWNVMGTRLLAGRALGPRDAERSDPVMVVSESLARWLWPAPGAHGHDALGRCAHVNADTLPCARVVGVAADIRSGRIDSDLQLMVYRPLGHGSGALRPTLLVRSTGSGADQVEPLRRELQAMVPGTVFVRPFPLADLVEEQLRSWTVGARVFGAFGVLALVMAAVGVFSVVAFEVTQRTREFGVRVALGARTGDLVRLVVRKGLLVSALGIGIGLTGALLLAGTLDGLLFEVGPRDPLTFVGVGTLLLVAAASASLVPAWRATRVDPQIVLRSE